MRETAAFAKAVGGQIAHVTAASNWPGIQRHGLRSAAASARLADVDPASIILRKARARVGEVTLNHQQPILHGYAAAHRVLDGHTPESWAAQLDERVFFWPRTKGLAFAKSVQKDLETRTLWLDAEKFAEHYGDQICLCALNSGNFTQGGAHARRGDWIYRPLDEGLGAFRKDRMNRGLVKSSDSIKEISLTCAIPPEVLNSLLK